MKLKDRVAIVTGGGRGIGRAYCQALAREGAAVLIADIAEPDAREVAASITSAGGKALAIHTNVAELANCKAMAKAAADAFGGIDILVNNAAMFTNLWRRNWDEFDPDEWDRVMQVNAKGPWLCAMAAVPYMKRRGKGKIINIGSGSIYSTDSRLIHYQASKGAVMVITRVLARELGDFNICVNCIAPGQVQAGTNEHNTPLEYVERMKARRCLHRIQTPEDLTGSLIFLASDDSDFMTGQVMLVDGGVNHIG